MATLFLFRVCLLLSSCQLGVGGMMRFFTVSFIDSSLTLADESTLSHATSVLCSVYTSKILNVPLWEECA